MDHFESCSDLFYFHFSDKLHVGVNDEVLTDVETGTTCCMIRAESMRYAYMLKKSILSQIPLEVFDHHLNSEAEFDGIMSQEVRKLSPLYLINENNYGMLVNKKFRTLALKEKKTPELFRIFQNHELWEKRYIQPRIRQAIKHSQLETPDSANYLEPSQCPDTLEVDFFTDIFFQDIIQEFLSTQEDHINLWKVDFDLIMLAIYNFYISPAICYHFPGQYAYVA